MIQRRSAAAPPAGIRQVREITGPSLRHAACTEATAMLARAIYPGTTYLVTRRTTRRTFLFRPDESGAMQNLFVYCLAVVSAKLGIVVHAVCLMSTHFHIVLTDTRGVLPLFLEELHTLLARATKCLRGGWPEEVFNKSQTSAVALLTPQAIAEETGYLVGNPVEAGAVKYARDWPGTLTLPGDIGRRSLRAVRPNVYFDPDNERWPLEVELPIVMHEGLVRDSGGCVERARTRIHAAAERHERKARDEHRRSGRTFAGGRRVLRVPFTTTSTRREEWGRRNPTFAAAGDRAAAAQAVARRRTFHARYQASLQRWRTGDRDVVFPFGTWHLARHHGVRVAPGPAG